MALLAGACRGNEETTAVPERVTNNRALELIRSCEVANVLFPHSGEVHLTMQGGRTAFVTRPDGTALAEAAEDESRACHIAIAID